ncbi:MAG: OsmC family peroxiredoxin, partial [Isosphaeraceae bacterium]
MVNPMPDTPARRHRYQVTNVWTGNLGSGTSAYRAYSRNHELSGA